MWPLICWKQRVNGAAHCRIIRRILSLRRGLKNKIGFHVACNQAIDHYVIRPIYLFSDSQLLFWSEGSGPLIARVLPQGKPVEEVSAAYIGASNGDNPDYFEIFRQAMLNIDVESSLMIPSQPTSMEIDFLKSADIILLAGGEVKLGWEVMCANGVVKIVMERYKQGAALIGISAGAIQLSLKGFEADHSFDTFQLVPFIIDVHDEANAWERLKEYAAEYPGIKAYGIPFGAGLIYHLDKRVEMLRYQSFECL